MSNKYNKNAPRSSQCVVLSGPHYKVHCSKDNLRVDIVKQEDISDIYLQHLKEYPGNTHIISYYYQHFPYRDIVRPVLQARGGGPPRDFQPELGRVLQVHGDQGGQPGHRQNSLLPARHRGVQGRTYSFHDLLTQLNNGKSNAIFCF